MLTFASPRIANPTGRKTECRSVSLGDVSLYFSYNTCIGVRSPRVVARLANSWGPTTGRHFKECYLSKEAIVSDEAFERIVRQEVLGLAANLTRDELLRPSDSA